MRKLTQNELDDRMFTGLYPTILRALKARGCDPRPSKARPVFKTWPYPPSGNPFKDAVWVTPEPPRATRALRATCPACGNRSLSVFRLDDGDAWVYCHAAYCHGNRALAVLGLSRFDHPESAAVRRAAVKLAEAIGKAKQRWRAAPRART